EMLIDQLESDLMVSIDTLPYFGTVVTSNLNPEKRAAATLTACHNDGDANARLESVRLVTKVSVESGKVAVKLTSVRGTDGSLECSGNYRRVDDAAPVVAECPVFFSCVCVGISGGDYGCGAGGMGGDRGDVHENVDVTFRDLYYVNGNQTGWECIAQ
ncbi:hypothetical protein K2X89_00270, partial [Myxococcota bacterium]|nr:hypothetical protein [Myxococcota bacterium]